MISPYQAITRARKDDIIDFYNLAKSIANGICDTYDKERGLKLLREIIKMVEAQYND